MQHVLVLVDVRHYVVMKTVIVCIIHTRHVAAVFVVDGIVEYIKILIWILVWNTLESIITPFTSVQIVLAHQGEARTYDRDNEDRLGSRDSDTRKEKPFFFEKILTYHLPRRDNFAPTRANQSSSHQGQYSQDTDVSHHEEKELIYNVAPF